LDVTSLALKRPYGDDILLLLDDDDDDDDDDEKTVLQCRAVVCDVVPLLAVFSGYVTSKNGLP